jgi:hypothetical protein
MARADLLKRLFEAYQRRDDQGFRLAANELVDDERKKHHAVVANELQRILSNGVRSSESRYAGLGEHGSSVARSLHRLAALSSRVALGPRR